MNFRDILQEREQQGLTDLYSSFAEVERRAKEEWLPAMRPNKGTINSYPHLQRVEKLIDLMTPQKVKDSFTSSEIYILLCAVYLHDIGKAALTENDKAPWKLKKNINNAEIVRHPDYHHYKSCKIIVNSWAELGIKDSDLARFIAIIACSHCWHKPYFSDNIKSIYEMKASLNDTQIDGDANSQKQNKTKEISPAQRISEKIINNEVPNKKVISLDLLSGRYDPRCSVNCGLTSIYTSRQETVHLGWIAALLRMGDEFDNHSHRMVPSWILNHKKDLEINTSIFNTNKSNEGEATKWRRHIFNVRFDHFGQCITLISNFTFNDYLDYILYNNNKSELANALDATSKMNILLQNWSINLSDLNIFFKNVFIEITQPFPCLARCVINRKWQKCFICESGLNKNLIEQVADSMMRLTRGVSGIENRSFSWKTLAIKSGINDLDLVKKYVKRLQAFSAISYALLKNNKDIKSSEFPKENDLNGIIDGLRELQRHEIITSERGWLLRTRRTNII